MQKIMQNPLFRLLPLIIFAILIYLLLENKSEVLQSFVKSPALQAIYVGKPAPDFVLAAPLVFNKQAFHLSSLKGYPLALHFWGTWCGPCVEELPDLIAQAKYLRKQGYSFVAIALDKDWNTVEDFFRRHPNLAEMKELMILVLDPKNDLAQSYGTIGVPETLLINRELLVDNKFVGPQKWTAKAMQPYWDALRK